MSSASSSVATATATVTATVVVAFAFIAVLVRILVEDQIPGLDEVIKDQLNVVQERNTAFEGEKLG